MKHNYKYIFFAIYLLVSLCSCQHIDQLHLLLPNKQDSIQTYACPITPELATMFNKRTQHPTHLSEVYNKGLACIIIDQNDIAYKHFKSIANSSTSQPEDVAHACYQIAHYEMFNTFDVYYDGMPSSINRTTTKQRYNKTILNRANNRTALLMYANTTFPCYNLSKVITKYFTISELNNTQDIAFAQKVLTAICTPKNTNTIDIIKFWTDGIDGNFLGFNEFMAVVRLESIVPYLQKMSQPANSILTANIDLYTEGLSAFRSNDLEKAFYILARSVISGDTKALPLLFDTASKYNMNEFKKNLSYKRKIEYYEAENYKKLAAFASGIEQCRNVPNAIRKQSKALHTQYEESEKNKLDEWNKIVEAREATKAKRRKEIGNAIISIFGAIFLVGTSMLLYNPALDSGTQTTDYSTYNSTNEYNNYNSAYGTFDPNANYNIQSVGTSSMDDSPESKQRWERVYKDQYRRYQQILTDLHRQLELVDGSYAAEVQTKSQIRQTENDLRRIKQEAAEKGIILP